MRMHRAMLLVAGIASLSCSDALTTPTPSPLTAVDTDPNEIIIVDPDSRSFDIGAGNQHSCLVSRTATLHCWGSSSLGQAPALRGGFPDPPYFQVSVGTGDNTCALRIDFTADCFGKNDLGQSPGLVAAIDGFFIQVDAGKDHACAIRNDFAMECWGGQNEDYAPPLMVLEEGGFVQVSAGDETTCGLQVDGTIGCGGVPGIGEEGFTIAPARFTRMSVGKHFVCAIRGNASRIDCRGANGFGQAPLFRTAAASHYVDVSAGELHACALRHDGVVECWGDNTLGQAPATRSAGANRRFVKLSAGAFHNCAMRKDTSVDCWGDNANGKLNAPPLRNIFRFRGFWGNQLSAPNPAPNHVVLYSGGRNVNFKFTLGSDEGLSVIAPGYPQVAPVNCETPGKLETGTTVSGTLSFSDDAYHYEWNVDGALTASCQQFIMKLTDGTYHRENFLFTGPPAALVKLSGGAPSVPTGTQVPAILIKAVDQFGKGIANREITFLVTQGGGTVELASKRTNFLGEVVVPAWTAGPPGPQTLQATLVALSGTFTLNLNSNSVP